MKNTDFLFSAVIRRFPMITRAGGYREKHIFFNLKKIEIIQNDETYIVFRFSDNENNFFDYEYNSNRITG